MMNTATADPWNTLLNYLEGAVLAPPNKTYLTSADLIQDIRLLQTIFPSSNLINPHASLLIGRYVKDLAASPGESPWQWQFLHAYAEIVRRVSGIPGWQTLRERLKSHRGFEQQLFATFFLCSHWHVDAIEGAITDLEADIALRGKEAPTFVEVKMIDQVDKNSRVLEAHGKISLLLYRECPKYFDGKQLSLLRFEGVVPDNLDIDAWRKLLSPMPTGPEARTIRLGVGHEVQLKFGWSDSGTIREPYSLRNLDYHLGKTEKRTPSDTTAGVIFVAMVQPATVSRLLKQNFAILEGQFYSRKVRGILFLEWSPSAHSLNFARLNILKTKYSTPDVQALDEALPDEWRFPYESGVPV